MKFVLATHNPDKLRELADLLAPSGIELVSLLEFPGSVAPEETGETLLENARIKARAAFEQTGLPAIADDTGLEVDALGGEPGVYAARFAGKGATYADNVRLLLERLAGVPPERRTARFRTVCVAWLGSDPAVVAEGVLEGRIAQDQRGENGFGYDPVFELPTTGKTLAELDPKEKNRVSHRAAAVRSLERQLVLLRRSARNRGPRSSAAEAS